MPHYVQQTFRYVAFRDATHYLHGNDIFPVECYDRLHKGDCVKGLRATTAPLPAIID